MCPNEILKFDHFFSTKPLEIDLFSKTFERVSLSLKKSSPRMRPFFAIVQIWVGFSLSDILIGDTEISLRYYFLFWFSLIGSTF